LFQIRENGQIVSVRSDDNTMLYTVDGDSNLLTRVVQGDLPASFIVQGGSFGINYQGSAQRLMITLQPGVAYTLGTIKDYIPGLSARTMDSDDLAALAQYEAERAALLDPVRHGFDPFEHVTFVTIDENSYQQFTDGIDPVFGLVQPKDRTLLVHKFQNNEERLQVEPNNYSILYSVNAPSFNGSSREKTQLLWSETKFAGANEPADGTPSVRQKTLIPGITLADADGSLTSMFQNDEDLYDVLIGIGMASRKYDGEPFVMPQSLLDAATTTTSKSYQGN
jgi:hypothetical protein